MLKWTVALNRLSIGLEILGGRLSAAPLHWQGPRGQRQPAGA